MKYKGIIKYLVFGVLTTLVNVIAYWLMYEILHADNVGSTIIAWIVAVVFAFVTNKLYVFDSKNWNKDSIREIVQFFGCRLGTGIVELVMMYVFVDTLNFHGTFMKLVTNFVVIVLNYIASKLIIFKQK